LLNPVATRHSTWASRGLRLAGKGVQGWSIELAGQVAQSLSHQPDVRWGVQIPEQRQSLSEQVSGPAGVSRPSLYQDQVSPGDQHMSQPGPQALSPGHGLGGRQVRGGCLVRVSPRWERG
jgi:hypothetical protein